MKKICIIGDSSIAVLRTATYSEGIQLHNDLTFFYCHNNYVSNLVLRGKKIVSLSDELTESLRTHSGGQESVDIDAYDEFVVSGLGLWIIQIVMLYQSYISDSMPGLNESKYLLSDECFLALAEEVLSATGALRLATSIRSVCDKPITVLAHPNPALGMPDEWMAEHFKICYDAVINGDDEALANLFSEACLRIGQKHNMLVVAPIKTVAANGVFNLREYCQLPADVTDRFDAEDLKNRMVHGNDLYGRTLLPYIFREMVSA